MAGSYKHIVGPNGEFTMDLIDNMGDAREALEECFAYIQRLKHTVETAKYFEAEYQLDVALERLSVDSEGAARVFIKSWAKLEEP